LRSAIYNLLLSNFLSEEGYPHDYALYEGIDHISKKGKGQNRLGQRYRL
jgi:hypothetical protein